MPRKKVGKTSPSNGPTYGYPNNPGLGPPPSSGPGLGPPPSSGPGLGPPPSSGPGLGPPPSSGPGLGPPPSGPGPLRYVMFLIGLTCVGIGVYLLLKKKDDNRTDGKDGKDGKDGTDGNKTTTIKCPLMYKGKTLDLCSLDDLGYAVFHRFNNFAFHDDNGSLGFMSKNNETNPTYWGHGVKILPGSGGNYRIVTNSRQLVAWQDKNENNVYPPIKTPSDADSDSTKYIKPAWFDLKDDKIVATLSKDKMATEWKIALDPKDANFIIIEIPDASTTGSSVKKFVGARLSLVYHGKGGWLGTVSWSENPLQGYNIGMLQVPTGVTPDVHPDWKRGSFKDQFTIRLYGTYEKRL